jgi:GNAT superfamily N-acetyltransferase
MAITTRDLAPELWPAVEALFGPRGACGGCWCQAWRLEPGEKWATIKGATAKERLRTGVLSGTVLGALAFDGAKPVGWCTYGPRRSFPRLELARTLRCDDAERVWSLPCFFVARGYRAKGVATALLAHAVDAMAQRGVEVVEGYPAKPNAAGRYVDTFAWTGTRSLFAKAGFVVVGNPDGSKQRVRRALTTG